MFEFENSQYPSLQLHSVAGTCRFEHGRFTTENQNLADALMALPDWYGIRLVSAPEPQKQARRPAKSTSKATRDEDAGGDAAEGGEG